MTAPLVLLHGFTGLPSDWGPALEHLPGRAWLAPALLGHGDAPRDGTSFEDEVDRIAALIVAAGMRGAHLAGYSLGGRVALGLLCRHRSLFSGATLVSTSPGLRSDAEREARLREDQRWIDLIDQRGLDAFADAWQAQPLFASQRDLAPPLLDAQRRRRLAQDPRGLVASLRVLGTAVMPSYWPRLPDLDLPISVLVGGLDAKYVDLGRSMRQMLPRASLIEVAAAGHNLLLEAPAAVGGGMTAAAPARSASQRSQG